MRKQFQQIRWIILLWALRCSVVIIFVAYYTYAGAIDTNGSPQITSLRVDLDYAAHSINSKVTPGLTPGGVERINLDAIKIIESSGNPKAFNSRTKCYGLYQISKICLLDYNQLNKTNYKPEDLFNSLINKKIAAWYFNRIQQMLGFYQVPVSTTTLVASYNWGIGNVVKWHRQDGRFKDLPKVTRKYIARYRELIRRAKYY